MQIVFGACLFVIAVIFLAYVPGKLLLIALKRILTPLEDVTLSCVLGLVVSGLVYWLMTFAHQASFYLLWPLTAAGVYVWLYGSKRKSLLNNSARLEPLSQGRATPSRDRSTIVLAGVLVLGIIALAVLPLYYTNFTSQPDGTMRVYPVSDVLFHIAIANELTHTVPPQAPVFAGHPLSYHYGMDLAVAMFARATGLNVRDLTVRFVPTLFVSLSMLSVFCFSRKWLRSGYFGALVVFLVFFGADFSFIPGLLLGEKGDWSLRYFSAPAVVTLFFTNPILPGLGVLFAGLFCLDCYVRERSRSWLFLTALLFVALIEVKMLMAAQLMCSLALAAVVYLVIFSKADLFKIGGCTAIGAVPLVSWVLLKNKSSAHIVTKFEPWLYVSHAMQTLGLGKWLSGPLAFAVVALPIYLVGCLGLRVIGVPAILTAIFRPRPGGAVRFLLGIFVVIGVVFALTCSFTPAGWTFRYNPISSTFLVQGEYVAWIFAVEVFQTFYQWAIRRGIYPALAAGGITAAAAGLSLPATVQHFVVWRDPAHFFGAGKPFGTELLTYDLQTLAAMDFLQTDAHPGDVVLPTDNLIAPVLALTKCRVPVGYFSFGLVARSEYTRRETAEKKFWNDWRLGKVEDGLLQDAHVRYVVVNKQTEGIPATIPASLSNVFENSEFAVFKVDPQRLSETVPQTP
ncbi:MAG: hypothetical protein ABJB70_10055 [Candidatus Udaeobacter sp.]